MRNKTAQGIFISHAKYLGEKRKEKREKRKEKREKRKAARKQPES